MSINTIPKRDAKALSNRIKRYLDNGAPGRNMAAECGIAYQVFEHIVANDCEKGVAVLTARKLTEWMDNNTKYAPTLKRCSKCGRLKPIEDFHVDKSKKDGHRSACAECLNKEYRQKNHGGNHMANDQPTKELIERVKAEDKRDVESKYMAPYFGIAPSLLDEIRAGKHDGMLFTPKPKPAEDSTAALNALRSELNRIERKMDAILMALDVKVVEQ